MTAGSRPTEVNAPGPPAFALHTLGWRAFQDLVAVMLREVMGQSFQVFADSHDAGRDGAFYGSWRQPGLGNPFGHLVPNGPFVLQCKFTTNPNATLTPSMIADELPKVRRLVANELCDSYILMTNARITGSSEARIRSALHEAGVHHPLVLAGPWICQTIASRRSLRMFVPRVYGLGDLSQILDQRAYAQAESLISYLRPELATFAATDAHRRAAEAIRQHGFVLLLGEPGAGKSVIAAILAMTALDTWGSSVVRAQTAEEFLGHWNPDEPAQFLWVDDAFGTVRHDWTLSQGWATRLASVMTAVKGGAKVVMTSRDYIYRDARRYLKEYAFPLLRESQVVVDVTDLTRAERERILYNHLRLGDQPSWFRRAVKPHLNAAADARPFRPEAARRLGQPTFTAGLDVSRRAIVEFIEKPTRYLADVFAQLDTDQQAALALVYEAGELHPPLGARHERLTAERFGSTLAGVSAAFDVLDGSFLRYSAKPGSGETLGWSFRHPTLREGFATFVAERPQLLDVFVAGLSDEALLTQVECGGAPTRGALVSIPPSLFSAVAARLASIRRSSADWRHRTAWQQFLIQRCSPDFLRVYMRQDPELVSTLLRFGSYLSVVPEPMLLARLHQTGLLTEADRQRAVATASDLAVETPDADWLDAPEWTILATKAERDAILQRVRSDLVPALNDELYNWRSNYDDQDPDDYYRPLEETLARYASALAAEPIAVRELQAALEELEDLRLESGRSQDRQAVSPMTFSRSPPEARTARSIFDDVDA